MQHSKLITALRACQKNELTVLRRFVASPYFNRREELSVLLEYLLRHWPDFVNVKRQAAFQAAFPNQAFDEKQCRYLLSDLTQLIETFWAVEKWKQSDRQSDLALLESASERQSEKTYRKVNRRLAHELSEPETIVDSRFFLDQLHWSEASEKHFARSRVRQFDDSVQRASDNLDRYYFLQKLKFACGMVARQAIFKGDYDLGLSEHWIAHLAEKNFLDTPVIRLYFTVFQALQYEQDESHFLALRDLLLTGETAVFSQPDLEEVFRAAINYCARKIRQGREDYAEKALELYTEGLKKQAFFDDGFLSPWTFTNVVKLSLRLKRYDWVEQFIREYAPQLPVDFRENALHYNLAELFYYTQRSDEAQQHLIKVAYSDLNYYLGARVMLAKIYHESGDTEPLLSLLAAFMIFLKRNKQISSDLKQTYLNFCDILFQLIRRHPKKMAALGETIRTTSLLTDRSWLLAQYEASLQP